MLHEVVHLRCRITHVVEHAARGIFAVFARKQIIDERSIARIGRDAAGGSVRRSEIAFIFKHRELVANRSRGNAEPVTIDQGARAHRLRVGDVLLDKRLKHFLSTVGQQRFSAPFMRRIPCPAQRLARDDTLNHARVRVNVTGF